MTHEMAFPATNQLVQLLSDTLDQIDGPDQGIVDRAAALWTLRHLDAELLSLLSDAGSPALVHRAEQTELRFLVFQGSGCRVQVEVVQSADGDELVGDITPSGLHRVALVSREASSEVELSSMATDELGRFRLATERGSVRVLVTLADGRKLLSPTIDV